MDFLFSKDFLHLKTATQIQSFDFVELCVACTGSECSSFLGDREKWRVQAVAPPLPTAGKLQHANCYHGLHFHVISNDRYPPLPSARIKFISPSDF